MATPGLTLRVRYDLMPQLARELPQRVHNLAYNYCVDDVLPQARINQEPHIDTGALNESGHVEDRGREIAVVFVGGALNRSGDPRVYGAYHELGTRFTGAYPFLAPAVDQTAPQAIYEMAETFLLGGLGA